MRGISALVVAVCLLTFGGIVTAQDPNYVLGITDAMGDQGTTVQATNTLDMQMAPNALAGWSWGVCNDDAVTVLEITDGADTIATNDGDGPDFNAPAILADGWTIGVVVNLLGGDNLPVGGPYELHHAEYMLDGAPGTSSVLSYCDTLGSPIVETVLVDTATPSNTIIPTQNSGKITINDTGGGCEFTFTAGSAMDVPVGGAAAIPITLDSTCDAEAFSIAIAHDTAVVSLDSIDQGAAVAATNGGAGPDFFGANVMPMGGDGGTLGVAVTIGGTPDVIPAGMGLEVALFNYTGAGAGTSNLAYQDGVLGDPPVSIVVTVMGASMPAGTVDGSISVIDIGGPEFIRADTTNDAFVDISDAVRLAEALLVMGADPLTCDDAGDADDDGALDGLVDTFYLLNDLFLDGPDVPAPNFFANMGSCGPDPTMDNLTCDDYQGTCP